MPNFKLLISEKTKSNSSCCEPVSTESRVQRGLRDYVKKRERKRESGKRDRKELRT